MPSDNNVDIGINFDLRQSSKVLVKWEHDWKKTMTKAEKDSDRSMKGVGKAVREFFHKSSGAQKMWSKDFEKANVAFDRLGDAITKSNKDIEVSSDALKKLNGELEKQAIALKKISDADSYAEARKQAKDKIADTKQSIKDLNKQLQDQLKLNTARKEMHEQVKGHKEEIEQKFTFDSHEIEEAAKEAGEFLSTPVRLFFSKDLPGMADLFGKGISLTLGKGVNKLGSKMGDALLAKASKMKAAGAVRQEVGRGTSGAAMKGLAAVIGPLGGLLKQMPLIMGLLNASIVGIVKMFVDAQSMVKDMNKELLASASTTEFFSDGLASANKGAQDLEKSLKKVTDAAVDYSANNAWGITKDTHMAVISTLEAEGVSLKTLEAQYSGLNKQTSEYSASMGSITEMTVTYSRALGVSVQEVGQLFGQMMTEMGSNVVDVQKEFSGMVEAAHDAGISGNKFFSMLRGMSSDMALFNTRFEDATKIMGKLTKIMNPKNAEKFMQFTMNAMKGLGRSDRITTYMEAAKAPGGEKDLVGIEARDLAKKLKDLSNDLGGIKGDAVGGVNKEDIEGVVRGGSEAAINNLIKGIQDKFGSEFVKDDQGNNTTTKNENYAPGKMATLIEELRRDRITAKSQGRGMMGRARNLGGLGAAGGLAVKIKQLLGIANLQGKGQIKDLEEMVGRLNEFGAEVAQTSPEELDMLIGVQKEAEATREQLKDNAKKDKKYAGKDQELADKLREIDSMGFDELIQINADKDKPDVTEQKKLDDEKARAAKEAEAAKAIGTNTQGIVDKLGNILDFLMNKLYTVVLDIWKSILHIPGLRDVAGELAESQAEVSAAGNKELSDIAKKVTSPDQMRDALKKSTQYQNLMKVKAEDQSKTAELGRKKSGLVSDKSDLEKALKDQGRSGPEAKELIAQADAKIKAAQKEIDAQDEINKAANAAQDLLGGSVRDMAAGLANFDKFVDTSATKAMSPDTAAPRTAGSYTISDMPANVTKPMDETAKGVTQLVDTGVRKRMSIAVHDWHAEKRDEDPLPSDTDEDMSGTLGNIYKALRTRGIKIEKFVGNSVQDTIHDAVLSAANEALVDYYMLQKVPQEAVAKAIQSGLSPAAIMGSAVGGSSAIAKLTQDAMDKAKSAPGASVAAMSNAPSAANQGTANAVTQKVEITLHPGAEKIFKATASNVYAENRSKEKFR